MITTFIIPSIDRPTLKRAYDSAERAQEYVDGKYLPAQGTTFQLDHDRKGESYIRNHMIEHCRTEWVSFLDDDDTVTPDYVEKLEMEIAAHPEADLIHFREYFIKTGQLLPSWPEVAWGQVGISFSVKRELAMKFPFQPVKHEDLEFVQTLQKEGYNIFFSKYITYHVRH